MDLLSVLILIAAGLLAVYFLATKRPRNYPPGPRGLPILGNFLDIPMKEYQHVTFQKFVKIYGDIFSFSLGPKKIVVLNNYKHIKEAFAEMKFSGRDIHNEVFKMRNMGKVSRGIIFNEGAEWIEQRRFCLKTLRDFGFGKKSMEAMVMEEVNELIQGFKKQAGQPISTQNRFNIAVLNALWQILTGERVAHDDPKISALIKAFSQVLTKRPLIAVLASIFPIVFKIRKWLPFLFKNPGKEFTVSVTKMIKEVVADHQRTLVVGEPRDFIDVYLANAKETTNPASSFHGDEALMQLYITMMDLFIAGAETTSTTLVWTFLILALHPDKQEKLVEDLKKVTGSSRHVSLSDRPQLPYLEAIITEVMRFSSMVPFGVMHRLVEDTQFHGYRIPKDTLIMPNLYAAHHDGEAWEKPMEFKPERFINSEGAFQIKNEAYMPFSTGKRICLGESLARDELFLFTGNLFQNLKVSTVEGVAKPTLEAHVLPSLLIPKDHELVVTERT